MHRSLLFSLLGLIPMAIICFFVLFLFVPSSSERYFGISFRGSEAKQISREAKGLSDYASTQTPEAIQKLVESVDPETLKEVLRTAANMSKSDIDHLATLLRDENVQKKLEEAFAGGSDKLEQFLQEAR